LRRERGIGLSAVAKRVNGLIRAGLRLPAQHSTFQGTTELGLRIDVSNVAEALDVHGWLRAPTIAVSLASPRPSWTNPLL